MSGEEKSGDGTVLTQGQAYRIIEISLRTLEGHLHKSRHLLTQEKPAEKFRSLRMLTTTDCQFD